MFLGAKTKACQTLSSAPMLKTVSRVAVFVGLISGEVSDFTIFLNS